MAPGTNIQIRKDYNPKQARAPGTNPPDNYLISPITGERVPPQEFDEHMKISLLDPKWKEQRDRYEAEKKQQETVFASGERGWEPKWIRVYTYACMCTPMDVRVHLWMYGYT